MNGLLLLLAACTCGPAPRDTAPRDTTPRDSEPAVLEACADPQPVLSIDGSPTGYLRCADGSFNRVEALPVSGDYSGEIRACEDWIEDGNCVTDADCQDPPGGFCGYEGGTFFRPVCTCTWPCSADSDCEPLEACMPPEVHELQGDWPRCMPARCRTGQTCGSGECAVASLVDCGWGEAELRCRQETDECRSNADCDGDYCWAYQDHMKCVKEACD